MPLILSDKDSFLINLCRGKRVLDVGCVNHTLEETRKPHWKHRRIKEVAASVVGVDYEAEAVSALCSEGYTIVNADAQDFDIRGQYPEGFEIVVASEIIEHLVNPGLFLQCVRAHLAPGGKLVLSTPHAYGIFFGLQVLAFGEERFNDDHTFTFSRKNLVRLLGKCGFVVEEFYWLIQDTSPLASNGMRACMMKALFLFQYAVARFVRGAFAKEMVVIAAPGGCVPQGPAAGSCR